MNAAAGTNSNSATANAQARLGEVTAATRAMQALLEKQSRFAIAYDLAGTLAILRNDASSAGEAFKTATALDPRLADAWISRGSLEAIARTPLDVPLLGNVVSSADVLGYFDRALSSRPGNGRQYPRAPSSVLMAI